jgi:hypothetical protein
MMQNLAQHIQAHGTTNLPSETLKFLQTLQPASQASPWGPSTANSSPSPFQNAAGPGQNQWQPTIGGGTDQEPWWCAACNLEHFNPSSTKCRACRFPRDLQQVYAINNRKQANWQAQGEKGKGRGKGTKGKGKGKQNSTFFPHADQLWTLSGQMIRDPHGWYATARRSGSMDTLTLYDQNKKEVDVEKWIADHQDKAATIPIAGPVQQPDPALKAVITDQKRLANLKAQAASIATEIANCVKCAAEEGDPDQISDIHSGFIRTQTANQLAINEMNARIAAAPPSEETNAEMKKRLNKCMQEWNIATKAHEIALTQNEELHQQAKDLKAKVVQSDDDLAIAAAHEATMRKEYDEVHANFPGGQAKLLLTQCQNPLTYDTDGVFRVSKLLTIAEEHRGKYTTLEDWTNKTMHIFRTELAIDTAICELFKEHCGQDVRYYETPHNVYAWLHTLLEHVMAGANTTQKGKLVTQMNLPLYIKYTDTAVTDKSRKQGTPATPQKQTLLSPDTTSAGVSAAAAQTRGTSSGENARGRQDERAETDDRARSRSVKRRKALETETDSAREAADKLAAEQAASAQEEERAKALQAEAEALQAATTKALLAEAAEEPNLHKKPRGSDTDQQQESADDATMKPPDEVP